MRKLMIALACLLICVVSISAALQPPHSRQATRSATGVVLSPGQDLPPLVVGELTQADVVERLQAIARRLRVEPIEPYVDQITKGVVPGLAGQELDVMSTAASIMAATANATISPLFLPIYPRALSDFAKYPVYQGNPARRQIALVINVAWGDEQLPEMLEILDAARVKASFFLVGRWVAGHADMVRQIAARGHEFGNHAYSDPHLPRLTPEQIASEITRTSDQITQITAQPVKYFSPPYNDFDQRVLDVAAELGYLTVLCSLDTADWLRPGVDRIVARIVPKAHNGAIVLMHPTEQTPAALRLIVSGLLEKGYQLVTISELLAPDLAAVPAKE